MTSIQLTLTGAQAKAEVDGILTSGMVGVPVSITWDESWNGLVKTLVCRSDGCIRTSLNVGHQATVAPEVLRTERWSPNSLYLGVEGRDAEGNLVIPSTFAYCGQILPGAATEGTISEEPENPAWAQILGLIGDMGALATSQSETLVSAINEAAGQGGQGTAENTQATNKGYVDTAVSQAAPVNLLDNSDFRNPVNQRGETNYSKDAWGGYTIDRWAAYESACTVTISNGGINVQGSIYQAIDEKTAATLNGKTVTVAAKIAGVVYCASGQVNLTEDYKLAAEIITQYGHVIATSRTSNSMIAVINNNTAAQVEWVALYEGEYTADTLPEYHPKGYGAELAECQRYYIHLRKLWRYAHNVLGFGLVVPVVCPVTMRLTPTAVGSVHRVFSINGWQEVTLNELVNMGSNEYLLKFNAPEGLDGGATYLYEGVEALSADL